MSIKCYRIEIHELNHLHLLRCLMQVKHLIELISGCYLTNLLLEVYHCLQLEYLLFSTHTKKCASDGVMPIPHPLVFPMVLSRVEFCNQFFSMFIWMV